MIVVDKHSLDLMVVSNKAKSPGVLRYGYGKNQDENFLLKIEKNYQGGA